MTIQHPAKRGGYKRGRFERMAETASNVTGSPAFYCFCVLLIVTFVVVHLLHVPVTWLIFVGDMMAAVSLLLLALLKNTERRAEHALQRKLDAIAAVVLEQHDGGSHKAHESLREAIRMDENV
ncbi:low affinity iron permease family protein [Streptomyces sp. WMMB 322]|uniref:low affinity iron permease family protein n=1 Tax=Streptomyces sp. WMMB 322 TaxID=1286821 RepID=UPI0006E3C607|nr:low affinity iron permease family protein [Streptomyces sp. WMMB 322]